MHKIIINSKDKIKVNNTFTNLRRRCFVIKQIAWNTFKNTGDINTFLELMEVENVQKNIINGKDYNGNIQDKWNNNRGK